MSGRVANTCQQTPSTKAENSIANGLVPAKGKQGKLQLKNAEMQIQDLSLEGLMNYGLFQMQKSIISLR